MFQFLGAFLAGRVNGPFALITTVLSAIPAAVTTNPQLIQTFGQAPAPGSQAELVTQIVSAVLTLVLFMLRGAGNKTDTNVLKAFALMLFVAAVVPHAAYAQTTAKPATLTFTWVLPVAREDGTAITAADLATCQVYEVTAAGVVVTKAATWTPTTSGTLAAVTGTKRYALTCTDKQGLESDLSNIVLVTASKPTKNTSLQVRVNFTTAQ